MAAASATHHRDLRTGRSIWSARRRPAIPSRPLTRDIACDAIVVGAGVSGALIAEALSEAGLTTVIVDRRRPAEGSPERQSVVRGQSVSVRVDPAGRRLFTKKNNIRIDPHIPP